MSKQPATRLSSPDRLHGGSTSTHERYSSIGCRSASHVGDSAINRDDICPATSPRSRGERTGPQRRATIESVGDAMADNLTYQSLYSAFMHAGHATSAELLTQHLLEDPSSTAKGLMKIAESVLLFVRECVKRGVDGFYMSTQGGEAGRFRDPSTFGRYITPSDRAVMDEIQKTCAFNILHVCDYHAAYDDLSPCRAYPGHVVNCGTRLGSGAMTPSEIASLFGRPFMGGMDRHGILVTGTKEQIRSEVRAVCAAAPSPFVLGADCTVPSDIPWDNLKVAIDEAHGGR